MDIHFHVALLLVYLSQLCEGYMEAVYHISGYFKAHGRSMMVFDDEYINWFDRDFMEHDWTDFYANINEGILSNAPEPRGMPVQINAFLKLIAPKTRLLDTHTQVY